MRVLSCRSPHPGAIPQWPHPGRPWPMRCRGVGLIEVLVALVVVTLGVMGLLAVQVQAQRQARLSLLRTIGSQLASDLAERMRANRDAAVGLAPYALRLATNQQGVGSGGSSGWPLVAPAVACDQPRSSCSATQMAAVDLFEWRQVVRARLPSGVAYIDPMASTASPGAQRQCGAPGPAGSAPLPPCDSADVWVGWRSPTPPAADVSGGSANACPPGLAVLQDSAWQCLFVRIRL